MDEKVLSQDEVDALLRGVDSGDVETATKPKHSSGIQSYDLGSQERVFRDRLPAFDMINERFIRLQAASWTATFRKTVQFSVASTHIIKFAELLKKISLPSSLNVFRLEPLRGYGLFVMDASLVYWLMDQFFGGYGQTQVQSEGRDFTSSNRNHPGHHHPDARRSRARMASRHSNQGSACEV